MELHNVIYGVNIQFFVYKMPTFACQEPDFFYESTIAIIMDLYNTVFVALLL